MIVTIGNTESCTGKTTIAVNLASHRASLGENVVIVDADKKQSAMEWVQTRNNLAPSIGYISEDTHPIDCVSSYGEIEQVLMALDRHYDHVIVDAGGMQSLELKSAMIVAQTVYAPVDLEQISFPSLLYPMSKMSRKVRKKFKRPEWLLLPNKCASYRGDKAVREAGKHIESFCEAKISGTPIGEHAAIKRSICSGLGVHELMDSDNLRAVIELEALSREVFDM